MNTITMGIDQSLTSTGVAVLGGSDLIHYEVISTVKSNDPFSLYDRIESVSNRIIEIVSLYRVAHVTIEGLSFASVSSSTRNLAGLFHVIVSKLRSVGIDPSIIAPTALKKAVTGKGTAKKQEMFSALPDALKMIFESIPISKGRYDLSDAYHLACYK